MRPALRSRATSTLAPRRDTSDVGPKYSQTEPTPNSSYPLSPWTSRSAVERRLLPAEPECGRYGRQVTLRSPSTAGKPAHPVATAAGGILDRLFALAQGDGGADFELPPYLAVYLAGHVADCYGWEVLAADQGVLDRLDPDRVAVEGFRPRPGAGPLPVEIAAGMVTRGALRASPVRSRRLVRALGVARLQRGDPTLVDPRVVWAQLRRVHEHLPLTGHASPVTGVCPVKRSGVVAGGVRV